jgi:sec-independent protein translocase protein TatB
VGSVGTPEILVILVVALIVLGPNRLPGAARQVGKAMSEFRRVSTDLQTEMRDAFSEPAVTAEPTRPPSVIEPVVPPPGAGSDPATPADSEVRADPEDLS